MTKTAKPRTACRRHQSKSATQLHKQGWHVSETKNMKGLILPTITVVLRLLKLAPELTLHH